MTRRFFLAGITAAIVGISPIATFADSTPDGVVEIHSGGDQHRFSIEIADDASERARGLMFRYSLPEDSGMLFIYPRDQIASFWMKNTFIPLDMLFIANDGTILQIARNVQPHNLTPVRSEVPVRAVLELNGGQTETLGIMTGDTVTLYR